ncbi:PorP/SprF family type IX secretion system membrane protein [Terrimonas rubra]|uniref:PorP/SprF family type IX secretion system membrane protein n=1 Tax=Terrimonas rubra TaxID=1035890 RepID=A0ABW6A6A1_9BACT
MYSYKPVIQNLLLLLLLATGSTGFAQDLHFSQFFETPLLRNPALAGLYNGDTRVQGVYRDQWNSVANAYRTGSVNGEMKFAVGRGNDFITPSLQVLYDRAGTIGWTSTHILPGVNYQKSLSNEKNSYLSLGVTGGVIQRRFDPSKMTTNSQYDNGGIGENLAQPQYTYFDGSVGMSYNAGLNDNQDNNYYLGVAFHHFNRPKQSFYRNPNIELNGKWVFSGGLRLAMGDYARATFMADHSFQGGFTETVFGGAYGIKIGGYPDDYDYFLEAGAFLRWNDAFIPVLKLEYKPFTVSFSYDVNISKLRSSSYGRGGFEIGVTYTGFRLRNSTVEYMRCPRF